MGVKSVNEKAVEVEGLSYRYPDGTPALRDINMRVTAGETVGIIGPNGAGKTTLLLHLNGVRRPTAGAVRVLGREVTARNAREVRSEVGLVFENPDHQLFMPTVFEDVAFGPLNQGVGREELGEIVGEALSKVGMEGSEQRPPHHLSLGERRRVALATVLAMKPRILVLDEPLAGLDPRGRRELMELIASLPGTKVIASHDLEMVLRLCGSVFVLDGGQIVAEGPTARLLSNQALMENHGLEVPASLRRTHYKTG